MFVIWTKKNAQALLFAWDVFVKYLCKWRCLIRRIRHGEVVVDRVSGDSWPEDRYLEAALFFKTKSKNSFTSIMSERSFKFLQKSDSFAYIQSLVIPAGYALTGRQCQLQSGGCQAQSSVCANIRRTLFCDAEYDSRS